MNFLTIEYVDGQNVVRDQITGQTYPYSTGADGTTLSEDQLALVTTRSDAQEVAKTTQNTLLSTLRSGGFLAKDATSLVDAQAAYQAYLNA